ncbi:MAG: peptide MFS transporter [Francisellaceae bacterium]
MIYQLGYALYGAYTALVYVTPIVGGMIADRYLGYYWASILGASAMVAGHLVLGLDNSGLYMGLALIICGYGLFKTNVSCLLGAAYDRRDVRRDSGFALMYVGGNIGAFIAPILCAWAAQSLGWHYGFLLAAIGMSIGLVIFIAGRSHFEKGNNPQWQALKSKGLFNFKVLPIIVIGILAAAIFFAVVLFKLFAGWILAICVIVSLLLLISLLFRLQGMDKKSLLAICLFMVFGLIFWSFDQQGGSSISLFIERNVIKDFLDFHIPAASFQSINPFAVLIGGVLVSYLWRLLAKMGVRPGALVKISFGMVLITIGFYLIMMGAKIAAASGGHVSMIWVIMGLGIMGVSELFVDPVALSEITRLNPGGQVGFLAGVYMLITGAIANYAAAEIAKLTAVDEVKTAVNFLETSAKSYADVFGGIAAFAAITTVVLIAICITFAIYGRLRGKI